MDEFCPKYVLGLLFDTLMCHVVVMRKNRPEKLAGFLNGVGGKVEEFETSAQAMRREFWEETGLDIDGWIEFARFVGSGDLISCFFATRPYPGNAKTMTDEEVMCLPVKELLERRDCFHNLKFLIQMALVVANGRAKPYAIQHFDPHA